MIVLNSDTGLGMSLGETAIVASDYLVQVAGALGALDSESKISPLSSPLGSSPGS